MGISDQETVRVFVDVLVRKVQCSEAGSAIDDVIEEVGFESALVKELLDMQSGNS